VFSVLAEDVSNTSGMWNVRCGMCGMVIPLVMVNGNVEYGMAIPFHTSVCSFSSLLIYSG